MPDKVSSSVEQRVRERAYEIYLARNGWQEGDELSDWLAAEREITASTPREGNVLTLNTRQTIKGAKTAAASK